MEKRYSICLFTAYIREGGAAANDDDDDDDGDNGKHDGDDDDDNTMTKKGMDGRETFKNTLRYQEPTTMSIIISLKDNEGPLNLQVTKAFSRATILLLFLYQSEASGSDIFLRLIKLNSQYSDKAREFTFPRWWNSGISSLLPTAHSYHVLTCFGFVFGFFFCLLVCLGGFLLRGKVL